MSSCDICGKLASMQAIVEGAEVNVCARCSGYGKITSAQREQRFAASTRVQEVQLVSGYGKVIQKAREQFRFSRDELAKKLNMREADLQHFEEEKFKPTEAEARKLSVLLKVNLISLNEEAAKEPAKKLGSRALTLGDVVIIKDKRR